VRGLCTASNRSIQWREKVIEPLFDSRTDHMIMYQLADKLGFGKELVKNIKLVKGKGGMEEPDVEDILREINRGCGRSATRASPPSGCRRTCATCTCSTSKTLRTRAAARTRRRLRARRRLLRAAVAVLGHAGAEAPGLANLYDTSKHVMDGGGNFRANFGRRARGAEPARGRRLGLQGRRPAVRLPEFDANFLKKLGWWDELTDDEKKAAEGKNWKTDTSGGIIRVGDEEPRLATRSATRGRGGGLELPDPVPQHREPIYSPSPELVEKYRRTTTGARSGGCRRCTSRCSRRTSRTGVAKEVPAHPYQRPARRVRGRGRGDALQPVACRTAADMFIEINPRDANNAEVKHDQLRLGRVAHGGAPEGQGAGHRAGGAGHDVSCRITSRLVAGQGTCSPTTPRAAHPIVRGEAANTATTYGYDSVTMMQETKTTLCRVVRA